MDETIKAIAKELKLIRIANDYTLEHIAAKTKVNAGTICRYESGTSDIKISTLDKIVKGYDIDTGFFLAKVFAKTQD